MNLKTKSAIITIMLLIAFIICGILFASIFSSIGSKNIANADGTKAYKVLFWHDKRDMDEGACSWKAAIKKELQYIHTAHSDTNITIVEKDDDFTLEASDLNGVHMVVMAFYGYDTDFNLSADINTQANADILKSFVNKGGRIMMFAEFADSTNEGNAILSGLAQKMGGGFEITTNNYDDYDFSVNSNYANTLAKNVEFYCNTSNEGDLKPYYVPHIETTGTADYIFRGGSSTDFCVTQAIGNGNITVFAEGNGLFYGGSWNDDPAWYDNDENAYGDIGGSCSKVMVEFLYNSLLDSVANMVTYETKYNLWIEGAQVTSVNCAGTGWSFDSTTNTLTLENYTFLGNGTTRSYSGPATANSVIAYDGTEPLNLVIKGENSIENTKSDNVESVDCIYVRNTLNISGDGKLNVQIGNSVTSYTNVIFAYNLVINSGDITITANADSSISTAIRGKDSVSILGGKLTAHSNGRGIMTPTGDLTISANITNVEIVGEEDGAIYAYTFNNAVGGLGWTDVEGTTGRTEIPVNASGSMVRNFTKVSFPYVAPAPDPEPTPTPDPEPTPAPTPKNVVEDKDSGVKVETSDGTEIPDTVTLRVVVKAEVTKVDGKVDPAKVQEKIGAKELIAKVYDVKLIQTIDGVEHEIQPSDIKDGMKIKVEMELEKGIKTKGLRILHVHNDGSIDEINNVNVVDGVAIVEVASLSEFVLVTPQAHGFCIGWVAFIFIMLELICAAIYVVLRFHLLDELMAKIKFDALFDKMNLLGIIGLAVSGALFIFALIALCLDPCGASITSFILALIICGGFTYFFIKDYGLINRNKQKAVEGPQEEYTEAQNVVVKDNSQE